MDNLPEENSFEHEPEKYWTEAEWEKHLLANEKLMDRYQKVWEEDPARLWDDPTDLYIKVHHGIDLGKDFQSQQNLPEAAEAEEDNVETSLPAERTEPVEFGIMNELDGITAYRLSMEFAVDMPQSLNAEQPKFDPDLQQQFLFHALRISADIAGGHGLGYEEENLCGNIVKNCWALRHTERAKCYLRAIIKCSPEKRFGDFMKRLIQIEEELIKRIAELRAKVWWD